MSAPIDPWDSHDHTERAAMRAIANGELRGVCAQRARKLRKRGERVFWSVYLGTYAWNPKARVQGVQP